VSDALLCACGIMLLAAAELLRRRARAEKPAPTPRPEHQLHQI
jgi:hypothetical protein